MQFTFSLSHIQLTILFLRHSSCMSLIWLFTFMFKLELFLLLDDFGIFPQISQFLEWTFSDDTWLCALQFPLDLQNIVFCVFFRIREIFGHVLVSQFESRWVSHTLSISRSASRYYRWFPFHSVQLVDQYLLQALL